MAVIHPNLYDNNRLQMFHKQKAVPCLFLTLQNENNIVLQLGFSFYIQMSNVLANAGRGNIYYISASF